jgi:RNA polymerase sigma-70 factor (ECF subfamily)
MRGQILAFDQVQPRTSRLAVAVTNSPNHFGSAGTTPVAATAFDEPSLISRVLAGDREAFVELIKPYERMVYASVMSILGNEFDAEEVSQEAFLKAFRALASFRAECKFSTWVVQIAINEARMKLRKERPHLYESLEDSAKTDDGEYVPRDMADWREIPSETLERKELRKALSVALNALPEKYRAVLVSRDVNNLSISETAQALGISEACVKTRLLRARLQMRDALAPGLGGAWSKPGAAAVTNVVTK